jgi:hypothetical protein
MTFDFNIMLNYYLSQKLKLTMLVDRHDKFCTQANALASKQESKA